MLKDANRKNVYPQTETMIIRNSTFRILGNDKSVVFSGVKPPPNRKVNFSKTVNKAKSVSKSATVPKEISEEKEELHKLLEKIQKEYSILKKELNPSKKRILELKKKSKN